MSTFTTRFMQIPTLLVGFYGSLILTLAGVIIELVTGLNLNIVSLVALFALWVLMRMRVPGYKSTSVRTNCEGEEVYAFYDAYSLNPFTGAWKLISLYLNLLVFTLSFAVLFGGYRPAKGQFWRETIVELNPLVFHITCNIIVLLTVLRLLQFVGKTMQTTVR